MNYTIEKIASEIKAARQKKGLSQKALSLKVGIPQSHLSKIEKGVVDLQTSTLIQISRALDLELVLVSKNYLSAVQALQRGLPASDPIPAYQLSEEDDGA